MNTNFIDLLFFPFLTVFILISILGFGNIFKKVIGINKNNLELKNLVFIQGLILIGFISIFINLLTPISNLLSIIIIFLGSILYIIYFLDLKEKKKEIVFIFIILIFCFSYAFYAGTSDDFNYHYATIKNFKSKNLYEIIHHRTISYNSHWLFLTSIFSLSFLNSTLFILTAIFFAITIYDLFKVSLLITSNRDYHLSIISFFILIFFLGVLNNYKDLGTDVPGVIVSIYILLIILRDYFDKEIKSLSSNIIFLCLLGFFAFIIKITNVLIFILLLFIFIKSYHKKDRFLQFFLVSLFPLPWFYQNLIISGCLIWPISFTCLTNTGLAINEAYLIESFAKGDISTTMDVSNFDWIKIWFKNHFNKLFEIYFIYILIILIPILYFLLKKENRKIVCFKFFKENNIDLNYIYIFLIILLCNIIWFLLAPAYRFGIFYNLSFIIILFFPFWILISKINIIFLLRYAKIIFVLICIYFIYENITKIDWYNKRYNIWPPFENSELLKRMKY